MSDPDTISEAVPHSRNPKEGNGVRSGNMNDSVAAMRPIKPVNEPLRKESSTPPSSARESSV
jgi:hypothetical protein